MTTDARRASSPLEILLLIASPADFPSWSREQQRDRNRRVLEWHDFIRARNPSVTALYCARPARLTCW